MSGKQQVSGLLLLWRQACKDLGYTHVVKGTTEYDKVKKHYEKLKTATNKKNNDIAVDDWPEMIDKKKSKQ